MLGLKSPLLSARVHLTELLLSLTSEPDSEQQLRSRAWPAPLLLPEGERAARAYAPTAIATLPPEARREAGGTGYSPSSSLTTTEALPRLRPPHPPFNEPPHFLCPFHSTRKPSHFWLSAPLILTLSIAYSREACILAELVQHLASLEPECYSYPC